MIKYYSAILIFCAILPLEVQATDKIIHTKSDLKMQIEKIKNEISEEEKFWAEEKVREKESEKRRKERYDSFNKEKEEILKDIKTTDAQIQERMDEIERLKIRNSNFSHQVKFLKGIILEEARNFRTLIDSTFPYRKEKRIETAELLIDDLKKDRISAEEGFNRLWVQYQSEHSAASDAEIFSGKTVLPNGKTIAVKYMRVGKQIMVYSTPAGDKMGIQIQTHKGTFTWLRENQMNFETRAFIRHAVAVAEGKAIPGFVPFPIQKFSLTKSNTKEGKQ